MPETLQAKLSALQSSIRLLRLAQISLVAIFLAVSVTVSLTSSEGPDEAAHFYFNRFVAKYGRLPINRTERLEAGYKADLPPLFYLIAGLIGRGVDLESPPFLKISRDNPRLQLVVGHQNIKAWRVIMTEDPFRGEILLWHLGRWVTLLCGLIALGLTYFLLRATQPDHPWLALSAVAVLGFLPTYTYISGVTGYEPLTGVLLTFYFLLLFYTTRRPARNWPYLALGLLMGLAALARQTPWSLIPIVPVLIIWLVYRYQWTWHAAFRRLALFGLGIIVTFGGWVLYIGIYFNQVANLGWFQGLISPILIGDGSGRTSLQIASLITDGQIGLSSFSRQSDTFWQWIWRFFSGIWGGDWRGWLLLGIWALALAGFIRRWRAETEQTRLWLILLVAQIGLLLFFPLLRFLFSGQASTAMSQHLLFPGGAAIMVLLVWGLRAWFRPGHLTGLLFVLAGVYLWYSIAALPHRFATRFPIQTLPLHADEQTLATFKAVSLVGFDFAAGDQVLETTLYWRTEESASEDYRVELTLVDGDGQPRARWSGQPLNGRYPTRAWAPGDRVRDVIYLPIAGLPAGDYQLQLRMLDDSGLISSTEGNTLSLAQVDLSPLPALATNTLLLGEHKVEYTFWQQNHPATGIPLYGENATVLFSAHVPDQLADEVQLKLIGPDGRPHMPVDQTGYLYNFKINPAFADGQYRLRVERWVGDEVVAQVETRPLMAVKTEPRQFEVGPISQPVSASFAGYVALLGYDLPQRRLQPGDKLPVTLHWQALRTIGADLIMFNQLIDEEQEVWAGRDRLAREAYSTMLWAPREIVTDPFNIQIDANTPDGIYHLLVGLYLPVGEASVSLPLMEDGQLSDVTSVKLGPIKVGNTPSGFTVDMAVPQVRLNQPFGQVPNLILLGYDLADESGQTNSNLKLTLYWRVESPLEIDYTTFVHLRNAAGQVVAQQDRPPLDGAYPTSLWDPGEIIADRVILPLTGELPEDVYKIVIGLYDFNTGQRLTVPSNPANEVRLADFEITP